MSRSPTIIKADRLHNPHAGEMLASEFMEPLDLDAASLAAKLGLPCERIRDVVDGTRPMDADLDLRLARYFELSDGFFLRLHDQYLLLEARRALSGQLDDILPRSAEAA